MQILGITAAGTLSSLKAFSDTLPVQGRRMPVLFTSHGSPMDIPLSKEERPFWKSLYDLGKELQKSFDEADGKPSKAESAGAYDAEGISSEIW